MSDDTPPKETPPSPIPEDDEYPQKQTPLNWEFRNEFRLVKEMRTVLGKTKGETVKVIEGLRKKLDKARYTGRI